MAFTECITNLEINVFSDFTAKKRWIENSDNTLIKQKSRTIKIEDEYNIIDEFDSHHNYLQSMFNYVQTTEQIDEKVHNYIFYFVNNKIINSNTGNTQDEEHKILNKNLEYLYKNSNEMIYNKDYGFSFMHFDDEHNDIFKICSPFIRKDTPVKNSNFSNILLTLILTFKIYIIEFNSELQDFDFLNIIRNKAIFKEIKDIDSILYKELYILFSKGVLSDQDIGLVRNIFKARYKNIDDTTKKRLLVKYLWFVNHSKLQITKSQINMSFQDIIYNRYNQWQVGYTGTTSLSLNTYDSKDKFIFKEKIEDFDEKIEVRLALEGYGAPNFIDLTKLTDDSLTLEDKIKAIINIDIKKVTLINQTLDLNKNLENPIIKFF